MQHRCFPIAIVLAALVAVPVFSEDKLSELIESAVRRAGAVHVFDSINHFFTISQMVIPGSNYWNLGVGLQVGDVNNDEEGLGTMKVLGENMAWVLQKLHG